MDPPAPLPSVPGLKRSELSVSSGGIPVASGAHCFHSCTRACHLGAARSPLAAALGSRFDGCPRAAPPLPAVFDRSVLVSNGYLHEAILAKTEPATARLLDQGIDLSQWFVPQVGAVGRCAGKQCWQARSDHVLLAG